MADKIPSMTIDALARSIYKQSLTYGFEQVDVIRLINQLMDLCTKDVRGEQVVNPAAPAALSFEASELPIDSDRLVIRAFDKSADKPLLEAWLPDKYGRFFVLSSATAQRLTVDSLCESEKNHLGIVCLPDGKPIGAMAYLDHSIAHGRAELRKLIGEADYRGQGYAELATRMWVNYGLQHLQLKKIYVSTLQTQINNIRLNEAVGFRVEGLLRNETCIDGIRCDVLRMAINVEDSNPSE